MTPAIGNFNPLPNPQPAPVPTTSSNQKMNIEAVEAYKGSLWTNSPAIGNLFFAPYEIFLAIASLIRATANQDKEGKLDATVRLIQQPFSFFGALGSLALTVTEIGIIFKTFDFRHYIPLPLAELSTTASSLGLGLCALELFFESLGLGRTLTFLSKFYCSNQPKFPNFREINTSAELKEKIISWSRRIIESPNSLQANLNAAEFQALLLRLNTLVNDLETSETPLTEAESRAQIEQFLQQVNDQLLLADIHYLHRKYFCLPQHKIDRIHAIVRQRFPDFSEPELNAKTNELVSQILTRKGSDLARRVQCWFVRELNEQLDPLIAKLSDQDPAVRSAAKAEARELLETMDIQARKKMIAHIIGIIGITILCVGLIIGFTPIPFVPLALLVIGGGIALIRYFFSAGYWHTRNWHFDVVNCIPYPIRWIYGKIKEAHHVRTQAAHLPQNLPPLTYPTYDNPFLFPRQRYYQLPDANIDEFLENCGIRRHSYAH